MKNIDLFKLQQGLGKVKGLKGVTFAYAIAKNSKAVNDEIELLKKPLEKYNNELMKLVMANAIKDKDGKIKQEKGRVPIKDVGKYNREVQELNGKYKKDLEDYEKLMNKESKVPLHKIKQADLPEDITASQIEGIMDLVE